MNNAAFADAAIVADRDARRQPAARPDLRVASDDAVFGDTRTFADTGARADATKRADRHVGRDDCRGINEGAGVNLCRCFLRMRAFPELGNEREVVIRIVGNDADTPLNGSFLDLR